MCVTGIFLSAGDAGGAAVLAYAIYTDDGTTYESYFVISTDLADKQGLHIKKRLLDIYLYFEKSRKQSDATLDYMMNTAKMYIKQDNEDSWQFAGECMLTGDGDIFYWHLPVDYLAKHFLIKIVVNYDFEFIGLISEFVPIGVR